MTAKQYGTWDTKKHTVQSIVSYLAEEMNRKAGFNLDELLINSKQGITIKIAYRPKEELPDDPLAQREITVIKVLYNDETP